MGTRRRDEPASPVEITAKWVKNPTDPEGDPIPAISEIRHGFTLYERTVIDLVAAQVGALPRDKMIQEGVQDQLVKTAISLAGRTWDLLERPADKQVRPLGTLAGSYPVELERGKDPERDRGDCQ